MVAIKDAVIVTVRNSSSRLPNKAILKIKGDLRSIDIVIERVKKTNLPVILATSIDESDNIFEKIALEHNVRIFRGALWNKIKRWYDCFKEFGIENALLVDGDDLSCNYEIGLRALAKLKSKNVDMIFSPKNIVTGFFTYAIKKNGISRMYAIVPSKNTNTDVITRFIEKANLRTDFVTLKDFECNEKIRLTLDYEEDLEFFRQLYNMVNILANGKTIINHLSLHPELLQINFHRQKDFLENQTKFNETIL